MVLDYAWKSYFTPKHTGGYLAGVKDWYQPFYLASLNLGYASDTLPKVKQYVPGQNWDDGLRINDMRYINITNTLRFGSTAQMIYTTVSNRDVFEIANNEGSGHQLKRMNFPFRVHQINLQAKDDSSFPTVPLFFGTLEHYSIQPISDVVTNDDDGMWRVQLDFKSFDHPEGVLGMDVGSGIWHHRANYTATDEYWGRFTKLDDITFDQMITRIVAVMNTARPTTDFPITFSYTPKGVSPYNININTTALMSIDIMQLGSWDALAEVLKAMGSIEGLGKKYIPTLTINAAGTTGTIDVTDGGYDKTATVDEDFRSTYGAQQNTAFTPNIDFNLVSVPFSAGGADAEFWIKFTLYKGTTPILNIPSTGYEYVPYDENNIQYRKYYRVPTQTKNIEYKWYADLVTSGSFTIAVTGGSVYSPQTYQFMNSPLDVDYKVRTFLMTLGGCHQGWGIYDNSTTPGLLGCHDGGLSATGGNEVCFDSVYPIGCYPDPLKTLVPNLTGTVDVTNGSPNVTGTGTLFTTELAIGQTFKAGADVVWHVVLSITDNTHLVLTMNYSATTKTGANGYMGEPKNPIYGIRGKFAKLNLLSNEGGAGSMETLCRKHSKKIYQCQLNTDSLIRDRITTKIIFNDGYTGNLIGKYVEIYSPANDDMIIPRVYEQQHIYQNGRCTGVMFGERV